MTAMNDKISELLKIVKSINSMSLTDDELTEIYNRAGLVRKPTDDTDKVAVTVRVHNDDETSHTFTLTHGNLKTLNGFLDADGSEDNAIPDLIYLIREVSVMLVVPKRMAKDIVEALAFHDLINEAYLPSYAYIADRRNDEICKEVLPHIEIIEHVPAHSQTINAYVDGSSYSIGINYTPRNGSDLYNVLTEKEIERMDTLAQKFGREAAVQQLAYILGVDDVAASTMIDILALERYISSSLLNVNFFLDLDREHLDKSYVRSVRSQYTIKVFD